MRTLAATRLARLARPALLAFLAALGVLLGGCATAPAPAKDPLLGVCPQWVMHGSDAATLAVTGNATASTTVAGNHSWQGRPLDLYRIRIDEVRLNGAVQMRAFANGTQLNWVDYRGATPRNVPVLTIEGAAAAAHEYDVYLTSVAHGSGSSPGPLTLTLDGPAPAQLQFTATYGYRVCGV